LERYCPVRAFASFLLALQLRVNQSVSLRKEPLIHAAFGALISADQQNDVGARIRYCVTPAQSLRQTDSLSGNETG